MVGPHEVFIMKKYLSIFTALVSLVLLSSPSIATLPDNGAGTAYMPLRGTYLPETGQMMQISNGLPPLSTIDIDVVWTAPTNTEEIPGGMMGGTQSAGEGSVFQWSMQGTGALSAYNRNLVVPLGVGASFPNMLTNPTHEVHATPRTAFAPVQSFDTSLRRIFGQITGDPDFDLLRVTAGNDFGLPSPGHTTLSTAGPGQWNVDSFFDITYRIDFIGAPGGPIAGMSGSTTGTIRVILPEPASLSALAGVGLIALRRARR